MRQIVKYLVSIKIENLLALLPKVEAWNASLLCPAELQAALLLALSGRAILKTITENTNQDKKIKFIFFFLKL